MVQIFVRLPESEDKTGSGPPEWTIIELQGDLESRSDDAFDGSFVGDLHYSNKGIPILIIGHHIMYGKIIKMEKPIVVLQRERTYLSLKNAESSDGEKKPVFTDISHIEQKTDNCCISTEYFVTAVVKKKLLFKTRPKPIVSNIAKKL